MRLTVTRRAAFLLVALVLAAHAAGRAADAQRGLPNPVLVFVGQEPYESGGKHWMRYKYTVANLADYPDELFAAAPELPPCGANTKAARTWVDLYAQDGRRLNGFCALGGHDGLGQIWFALEEDALPPSWIYVELNDRRNSAKYKSNLAESTL